MNAQFQWLVIGKKMVKLLGLRRKLPNDVPQRQIRYKVGRQYNLQTKPTDAAESSFSTHLFRGRYTSNYPVPAAARMLGLRVRILPGLSRVESCVLSGRGLRVGLITSPEGPYCVWCVWVWSWSLDEVALAY